jgi:hypothetical protein
MTQAQLIDALEFCVAQALRKQEAAERRAARKASKLYSYSEATMREYEQYFDKCETANRIPLTLENWIKLFKPDEEGM